MATPAVAAGEQGPFLLVGHSIGGTITRLYATTYPDAVAGLVLVDASSEFLQDNETPEQMSKRSMSGYSATESAMSAASTRMS